MGKPADISYQTRQMPIRVLSAKIGRRISNGKFEFLAENLPELIQEKIYRYVKWQDRQAVLFGKLLLLKSLLRNGYPSSCLNDVIFSEYGRPYIHNGFDFNISHSDEYVVCAFAKKVKVGIDIERIRPIDFPDFENCFASDQWTRIKESSDPYRVFFEFWTIKESTLKADGRGLTFPLSEVIIEKGKSIVDGNSWYFAPIDLDPNFVCHLATDAANPLSQIEDVEIAM